MMKNLCLLSFGLIISFIDMSTPKSLKVNILKRFLGISTGLLAIFLIDTTYLNITLNSLLISLAIGITFGLIHIIISKGIKLKIIDINLGLIKTSILLYFLELPSEEFIYRCALLLPLIKLTNPFAAITISSLLFLLLHLKTWNSKFVWFGSLLLGVICACSVYLFHSIWSAIIIHNLNDFAFLTLINKRNIFSKD